MLGTVGASFCNPTWTVQQFDAVTWQCPALQLAVEAIASAAQAGTIKRNADAGDPPQRWGRASVLHKGSRRPIGFFCSLLTVCLVHQREEEEIQRNVLALETDYHGVEQLRLQRSLPEGS